MDARGNRSIVFLDAATLGEPGEALAVLAECYPCTFHEVTAPGQIASRIAGHAVAVTNKVPLRAETLASDAAAALELIAVAATGVDIVDLEAARERGIAVANVVGYSTRSVAELSFALLFELAGRVGRYDREVRDGAWEQSPIFTMFAWRREELAGKTLGIVGHGAIGRAVEGIARAVGMEVLIGARPGQAGPAPLGRVSFEELLTRCDVVTLHCPLITETARLVNDATLARMKRGAWLINTARGGLVDEDALVRALRSGRLGGAALDVLSKEPPPPDHPLLAAARELPNLVLTPHVGWNTEQARSRLVAEVADNIHAFFRGERRNRLA